MCGIAGVVDSSPRRLPDELAHTARTMAATLAHRGPDDGGVWADPIGGVALGYRRLAVVDPGAAGTQPMWSPSGRYVAVFNGEVYGHERLRSKVDAGGRVAWRGHSDTEVLLAAIDRWASAARSSAATPCWAWPSGTRPPVPSRWPGTGSARSRCTTAGRGASRLRFRAEGPAIAPRVRHDRRRAVARAVPAPHVRPASAHDLPVGRRMLPPGSLLEVPASAAGAAACPEPVSWWDLDTVIGEGVAARHSPLPTDAVDELSTSCSRCRRDPQLG